MSSACGTKVQPQTFEIDKLGIIHQHRWKKGLKISKNCRSGIRPSFHWGPEIFLHWYLEGSIILMGKGYQRHRGSAFHNGTWFVQLWTNKFQLFFKDFLRKNYSFQRLRFFKINWHLTLLVKTPHGVIYDFYFSHRSSHYFMLFSTTRLCKMTGYDLQLYLWYRNSIWNKTLLMCKNVFILPVSFTRSYSIWNNLILQQRCLE